MDGLNATFSYNRDHRYSQKAIFDQSENKQYHTRDPIASHSGYRDGFVTDNITRRAMQCFLLGTPWRP